MENATTPEPSNGIHERAGPLDNLTTAAGLVTVKGSKTLTLAGKPIGEAGAGTGDINIERAFDFPDKKTALLMSVSDGGKWKRCPLMASASWCR